MQLKAIAEEVPLLILVDLESNHNFIIETAGRRLGIPIQKQTGLRISVANGERVSNLGMCTALTFQ